jgi:hypothetical protein
MAVALRIMAAADAGQVALGDFGPLLHSALARENPGAVCVPQAPPVDVLAVMADVITESRDEGVHLLGHELHNRLLAARAAVAELIEAARESEAHWSRIHDGYPPSTAGNAVAPMRARLRAAIARVVGAA